MEKKKIIDYLYSENKPKLFKEKHYSDYITVSDVLDDYSDFFEKLNTITNIESPSKIQEKIDFFERFVLPKELTGVYSVDDVILGDNCLKVKSRYGNIHVFKGLDRFLSNDFKAVGEYRPGDLREFYYKNKKLTSVEEFFKGDEYYELITPDKQDLDENEQNNERYVFKHVCKTIGYYWNGQLMFSTTYNSGPVAVAGFLLKDKKSLQELNERNSLRTEEAYEKKQEFYHIFPIKLSNGDYLLFKHPAKYLKDFNDYGKNATLVTDKLTGKKEFFDLGSDFFSQCKFNLKVDSDSLPKYLYNEELFTNMFNYDKDINSMKIQFEKLKEKESLIEGQVSLVKPPLTNNGNNKKELLNEIYQLRDELYNRVNELNGLIDEQNSLGDEIISHVYLEEGESNIQSNKSRGRKLS